MVCDLRGLVMCCQPTRCRADPVFVDHIGSYAAIDGMHDTLLWFVGVSLHIIRRLSTTNFWSLFPFRWKFLTQWVQSLSPRARSPTNFRVRASCSGTERGWLDRPTMPGLGQVAEQGPTLPSARLANRWSRCWFRPVSRPAAQSQSCQCPQSERVERSTWGRR